MPPHSGPVCREMPDTYERWVPVWGWLAIWSTPWCWRDGALGVAGLLQQVERHDAGLAGVDPELIQDRHQCLAEGLERLRRLPDVVDPQTPILVTALRDALH